MHAIDTNKNGVVESAEFVATGETQEEFNQLALNRDGVLYWMLMSETQHW